MFDIAYKLARKALPRKVYSGISGSFLGRDKSWKTLPTYEGVFRYYQGAGLDFRGRNVIEVGCGDQLYTALYLLQAGAESVHLVEPKLVLAPGKLDTALESFTRHTRRPWVGDYPATRILAYRDLREMPSSLEGKADLLVSHLVLEHVPDLGEFFGQSARVLAPGGLCHHRVDLSDHSYHVFGKYPLLAAFAERRSLFHLRYSDAAFDLLNDPKCFMNRKLLPEYLALAAVHGFEVKGLKKRRGLPLPVHQDLRFRQSPVDPDDLAVAEFSIDLKKSGGP